MKPISAFARGALLLILAFLMDVTVGTRLSIRGVEPDITMAALVPTALAVRAVLGAWLGLLAGVLNASFVSLAFGSYVVSRCLTGWLAGLLEERVFRDNLLVTVTAGFLAALLADSVLFLFAPQANGAAYFAAASWRALYTAAFVTPFALLVRRLYAPGI